MGENWTESSSRYVANKIHYIVKFLYLMNVLLNQKLSHILWKIWKFYIYIYKHLGCFHYSWHEFTCCELAWQCYPSSTFFLLSFAVALYVS